MSNPVLFLRDDKMMNMKMKVTNTRMAILMDWMKNKWTKNFLPDINQGKNYTFNRKNITTNNNTDHNDNPNRHNGNFGRSRKFVTTKMVIQMLAVVLNVKPIHMFSLRYINLSIVIVTIPCLWCWRSSF